MSYLKGQLANSLSNLLTKVKTMFHPLLRTIKILFKKYMGKYINEELQLDQFTGMGLKNLTLKADAINQLFDPSVPFVLDSGSIGLFKLELRGLTLIIDNVNINLRFKTMEQYHQFRKNYKKIQITAQKLEKLKEACMKDLTSQPDFYKSRNTDNVSQEELSQDLLKQILSKLKLKIKNVCIRLEVPLEETTSISILLSSFQISMRRIVLNKQNKNVDSSIFQQSQTNFNCQDSSTSMTCTILFMGISVHINSKNLNDPLNFLKETCILSLANLYDPLLKQHLSCLVVQLKVDVKERLKYRGSTHLGKVEASFTQQQLSILIKVLLKLQESQSKIAKCETSEVTSKSQEDDPIEVPIQHISWTNSIIKTDYLDGVFQQTTSTLSSQASPDSAQSSLILSKNDSKEANSIDSVDSIEKHSIVLQDTSMSQSETNEQGEINDLGSCDQSYIIAPQCIEESLNESQLQISCYENPHLVKQINVKDQERGLKELDQGNLIFAFKLETLVVTVRMDNKPLEGKRWLFSYASDKIQDPKQDRLLNILNVLNTQLECDHYVFVMNQTEIRMQKLIQENKTELKITHIKGTQISINQLDLVEVKYGMYQNPNNLKSSESDDMSLYSCNEIQDNNNDFEEDDIFHSVYDNKQLQSIIKLSTDEFVQVIDEHILLDNQINIAKQDYFQQNNKYFQIQSILSLSQKSVEQLVSSIKLENQITVFLFQPTQQSIDQEVSEQAAINILIQNQDTDSHQIICINCNLIYFDINIEQIQQFQNILASCQSSQIESMKSTSENKSLIQFQINQLNCNLIIQQPNLINMYFMQNLSESKMLNYQIQLNLKKNSLLYYSFTTYKILCQIQQKKKHVSFEMAKIERSQMNHLCEITRNFQIYHQEILTLLTKEIYQFDQQSKLHPLIKISNHLDVNLITIGLPIVIINVQAECTSFIEEIQQFIQQLGSKKQVNQQNTNVTELLIDELKVFANESEQLCQMGYGIETINYSKSYRQRVGLHATKVNVRSSMNHDEKTVDFTIYNLVLWDSQRYNSCTPIYGSFDQSNKSYLSKHQQHLAYRSAKYKVETVVLYKQDRCNREKFGNLINENEIFEKIDQTWFPSDDAVEEIPILKKIHSFYINPDFQKEFTRIHRPHCILSLKLNQECDNIKVQVDINYAILTMDQQIKDTIDFLESFKPKEKQGQVPQKNKLKLVCRVRFQNVWLSVFPTYNRKMLLKKFIERKGHIQKLSSENCDQYYYSWIRAVILINNFVIDMQINKEQFLINQEIDRVELYLKNTSAPNMPYSNPILLIQAKKCLYVRNRKISDAFQIDNDRQALLDSLNFHKIAFIVSQSCSVDWSEKVCVVNPQNQFKKLMVTIHLLRICFKLRRDSLKALMFLVQLDHQRTTQNNGLSRKVSGEHSAEHATTNPKLDIFTKQEVESPITHDFKQMHQVTVTVKRLEVHLKDGFQFPKEIFSIEEDFQEQSQKSQESLDATILKRINQEKETLSHLTGYEIYHLDFSDSTDTDLEVQKVVKKNYMNSIQLVAINIKSDFKYESNTSQNLLTIENMYVQDSVKLSKFSRVFAKESNSRTQDPPENLLKVDFLNRPTSARIPSIQLLAHVHPIRVCIGGATFEFLFQYLVDNCQWECPQTRYFARLEKEYQNYLAIESSLVKAVATTDNNILIRNLSRKALVKLAKQENYDLVIQHHHSSRHIHVDQIYISKIIITISYDGSGIAVNSMLKGLIWLPSYNNLQLILKPASLKNMQFDQQTALLQPLIEQYVEYIHQNKQFIQAVFLENKALKNVSDILWGFRSLVQSTIKEGFLVGISVGSIPLMQALADELLQLAKKPFDLAQSVSEEVGLIKFSTNIIKPMSQVLQKIGNHISYDLIPSEFLEQQEK